MVRKAFADMVKIQVEDILGEDYEVKVTEVNKNNAIFTGIVISDGVNNTSPCIYIDQMQDAGLTTVSAAKVVVRMYENNKGVSFDSESFANNIKNKDWVLANVLPKLVNGNSDDGEYVSYPFLDMKCWFYVVVDNEIGNGMRATCGIRNGMIDITAEELFKAALNNMSVFKQNIAEMLGLPMFDEPSMLVLTNEEKMFGAAVMANREVLKGIADEFPVNVDPADDVVGLRPTPLKPYSHCSWFW